MWPRTETTNVSGSTLFCQPQSCFPVSFRGGNRKSREDNQAGAGRKIGERIDIFPPATAQNAPTEEKQGDVRTQSCGQLMPLRKIQMVAAQFLEAQNCGRGIGTGSPQPAAQGNPFRDAHLDISAPTACLRPRITSAVNQIARSSRDCRIIAFDVNSLPRFGNADFQAIVQPNRLVNGSEFVEAIGPLGKNLKPGVDFGEGAKTKCFWQVERVAGRHNVRPTRRFLKMAPLATNGAGTGR